MPAALSNWQASFRYSYQELRQSFTQETSKCHKLPENNKVYIRRHNDEVERRTKLIALQKAFSASTKGKQPDVSSADKIKLVTAMLAMLV